MKRGDLLLILGITYMNFISDERAKLLWFTFESGFFMTLHAYMRPSDLFPQPTFVWLLKWAVSRIHNIGYICRRT